MTTVLADGKWKWLLEELDNFQEIAKFLKPSPGAVPELPGVDIHGVSLPLNGIVGGDHILYVDFAKRFDLDERIAEAEAAGREEVVRALKRNKRRAGIMVADVAGHRITDALLAAMLHQAFLLGSYYELDMFGAITTRIFENINERFCESTTVNKFLTMIYGEISDEGKFRFFSAGHAPPVVFSREFGRIMNISADRTVTYPPIGVVRSAGTVDGRRRPDLFNYRARYTVNEINLMGRGDVLLIHTDGLADHGEGSYLPSRLEHCLADARDGSAAEISERLREDLLSHAAPRDDISFVVIKKN